MPEEQESKSGDFLHLHLKDRWTKAKKNLRTELRKSKEVAVDLRENAEQALLDIRTGKVFSDDGAAENLKNTLLDSVKAAGMTGIFLLPGGSVGLVALRKLLKVKGAKKLGIENLLTLTVEESKKAVEEVNDENDTPPDEDLRKAKDEEE